MVILIRTEGAILLVAECIYLALALCKSIVIRRERPTRAILMPSLPMIPGALVLLWLLNNIVFYAPAGTASYYSRSCQTFSQLSRPGAIASYLSALYSNCTDYYYIYVTCITLSKRLPRRNLKYPRVALATLYLLSGIRYFTKPASVRFGDYFGSEADRRAMEYLSAHVSEHDIILASKPRLVALFTNKKSMNVAWQLPMDRNKEIFDSLLVKYVLVPPWHEAYLKIYLHDIQHPVDSVMIADG